MNKRKRIGPKIMLSAQTVNHTEENYFSKVSGKDLVIITYSQRVNFAASNSISFTTA